MKKSEQINRLKKRIAKLKAEQEINQRTFDTATYIRDCALSYIIEKGLSNEYYTEYRYSYAGRHMERFKETNLFEQWKTARAEVLVNEEIANKLLNN